LLYLFSLYTDAFEKKVDRFLRKIKRHTASDLENLMQQDLVRLTIFLEYRFKGYKNLKRRHRRKLYKNIKAIEQDFEAFILKKEPQLPQLKSKLNLPNHLKKDLHFDDILLIMAYLKPGRIFEYQASVSFERLLRDPRKEKLIGDCNQIVTLYIYLFSLRHPASKLKIKLLSDHVCLHYQGQDIEATSATLAEYNDYLFLSDATEIISTNLLDIPEPGSNRFSISPKSLLQAAQFAYKFSSHRPTVERNLLIAYHNISIFYAQKKSFKKAIQFADKSGSTQLQKQVRRMEAIHLFKTKKYEKAAQKFNKISDAEGVKSCQQAQLSKLIESIKSLKTIKQLKQKKSTLRHIRKLALKLGKTELVKFVDKALK